MSQDYYEKFVALLQSKYKEDRVKGEELLFHHLVEDSIVKVFADGKFGAHMQVSLVNDGPVTVMIDTNGLFGLLSMSSTITKCGV